MLIESTPDFPGNIAKASQEENDSNLYEEIVQETRRLIFIKIYFNQNHQGRIRMLEYVFMKNKEQISTLIPYLEKTHPEILWEELPVYREQKKKYTLEFLDLKEPFENLDQGDILLFDVGRYQSSPPYLPAVDYYNELSEQIRVRFAGAKTGLSTFALLSRKMPLNELCIYVANVFYDGTVDPEKILLKAKYKTSQLYVQVTSGESKDGRVLTLGDLTKFDETIIYEESQVPVADLNKYLKLMVSYYSVCTNECTREEEIYIDKLAVLNDLIQKIIQEKIFESQMQADKKDLAGFNDKACNTLIVTVHDKYGNIVMKCPEESEIKVLVKKGKLRVQFWSRESNQDEIEAFCYHTTRDSVVIGTGTAFLTKFKNYFSNKMIRTHLYNQMNDWELEYGDKKVSMTSDYMQKLRINFRYEKPKESTKLIKLEETNDISIQGLDFPKGTKIEIEIIHPTVLPNAAAAMKIS